MTLSPELRVLIVDDSKSATLLLKQQLTSLGVQHHNIHIALNWQQTFKEVESHAFDILLIDYHLEQTFTGFELIGLLFRNRLIDATVATILLSGDMRQETVLTALSGQTHYFLSKPIQTKSLSAKVNTALKEAVQFSNMRQLYPIDTCEKLTQAETIANSGVNVQLEASLIEHLIGRESWQYLQHTIRHSTTSRHPTKLVAEALILETAGLSSQAIDMLHRYLIERPLSLTVIDCLSCLYERNNQPYLALKFALKAFELTPSISHRAIKAIELSNITQNVQALVKIGCIYSSHISPADIDAMHSVALYFNVLQASYITNNNTQNHQMILKHASHFATQACRRLPLKQQQQILATFSTFQSHILISSGREYLAHQKAFRAVTLLSPSFNESPTLLLNQLIPLFNYYGEYSLYAYTKQCIRERGAEVQYIEIPGESCFVPCPNLERIGSLRQVEEHIDTYPYSVAAKLDYLFNVHKDHKEEPLTDTYLKDLTQLELPPKWNQWLSHSHKHGFATEPPHPFIMCH